jgi:type II secretory pathway component GspD/PulD (secretin)
MKPISVPVVRLFTTSTIRKVPLAIVFSLSVNSRFKANRSLLLVSLFAIGAVSTAAPALAGSGGWNKTGSMHNGRFFTTATLLSNGQVLVAGGGLSAATLGSAELYNPASGKWTTTGNMTTPRFLHQAVQLQNGQVLVAGGFRREQ